MHSLLLVLVFIFYIVKGEGAQHAIMDSINLGNLIVEAHNAGGVVDYAKLFKQNKQEMIKRGQEAVMASRGAVNMMHRTLEEWRTAGPSHFNRNK